MVEFVDVMGIITIASLLLLYYIVQDKDKALNSFKIIPKMIENFFKWLNRL